LWHTYADGSCGTYDVVYQYNSPECGYIPPTATPTPEPTATPLPTATPIPPTYEYVELSVGINAPAACTSGSSGYYLPSGEVFATATSIFSTNTGAQADAQWYSNGTIARYWDGVSITNTTNCDGSPQELG
jgi:hypothetical protein